MFSLPNVRPSVRPSGLGFLPLTCIVFFFLWILFRFAYTYVRGKWFGIVTGQISSNFDRVICPPHDSGGVLNCYWTSQNGDWFRNKLALSGFHEPVAIFRNFNICNISEVKEKSVKILRKCRNHEAQPSRGTKRRREHTDSRARL